MSMARVLASGVSTGICKALIAAMLLSKHRSLRPHRSLSKNRSLMPHRSLRPHRSMAFSVSTGLCGALRLEAHRVSVRPQDLRLRAGMYVLRPHSSMLLTRYVLRPLSSVLLRPHCSMLQGPPWQNVSRRHSSMC